MPDASCPARALPETGQTCATPFGSIALLLQAGATLAHPEVQELPPQEHSPAVFDFTHPTNKRPS